MDHAFVWVSQLNFSVEIECGEIMDLFSPTASATSRQSASFCGSEHWGAPAEFEAGKVDSPSDEHRKVQEQPKTVQCSNDPHGKWSVWGTKVESKRTNRFNKLNSAKSKLRVSEMRKPVEKGGARDGARTRDLRRDRPAL